MVSTGQASFAAKKVGVLLEATAYGDSLLPQLRAQLEEADALRKAIEGITFRGLLVDWDFATDRHAGPTADDMVLSRSARFSNGAWERFDR